MDKKKYRRVIGLGVGLFVASVVLLITAATLQEAVNASAEICGVFGISAFLCMIASVIVLVKNFKGMLEYETEKRNEKLRKKTEMSDGEPLKKELTVPLLGESLKKNKFEEGNGFFYRSKFSFWNDAARYFWRIREIDDIKEGVREAVCLLSPVQDRLPKSSFVRREGLLIVVFVPEMTEERKEALLELNIGFFPGGYPQNYVCMYENIYVDAAVTVVVYDKKNKKIFAAQYGKANLTLQATMLRRFRKLLKREGY